MQIHEITQGRVDEGLGSAFVQGLTGINMPGNPSAQAAKAAKGLTAQGYGPGAPKPSDRWKDKYKAIQQDPAVKQYAANMAQTWLRYEKELLKQFAPVSPTTTASATTPPVAKQTTPTTPAKPGQMPASVAASKTGQNMQKMWGQPKGGIQGMQSDLEEAPEYTTPGGIVIPGGSKTDAPVTSAPTSTTKTPALAEPTDQNRYLQAFKNWAHQTLATRVPATGETVTMDKVELLPELGEELTQALDQVVATQGKPQHIQAIQNYIMLASAGVQALAQTSKNKYGTVKTSLGIGTQELASLKALARTPQGLAIIKQEIPELGL